MFKRILMLVVLMLGCYQGPVAAQEPLTLHQAYQLALKRSEFIATKEYLIKEAEAQFIQSLSTALPKVNFKYDHTYTEDRHQSQLGRFTLSQPLFSGFKEFAAIRGAKALSRMRQQEVFRAKQLLFIDMSDIFYLYWFHQQDEKAVNDVIRVLQDQVKALQARVHLGRTRSSELSALEARLARKHAELIQIQIDIQTSKSLLEFLIGRDVSEPIEGDKMPAATSRGLNDYVQLALKRSDVIAAQEGVRVAQQKVTAAKAGFWPKVSVDGDYYTKKNSSTLQDWDVTLKFDVPIFQGGENLGNLKLANAVLEESKLLVSETERRAVMETKQAFAQWEGALKRREAFTVAFDKAKENYGLQDQDYKHQQINVIDLLQTLEDLEETRRDIVSSQVSAARAWWNLKVMSGDIEDVAF